MSGYYPLYVGAAYPASGGGGSGDMVLASVQTVTGAKTFNDSTLLLANVAGTFSSKFTNTNTAARTYTLPDAAGTVALTSNITGTNSGTNTGDQTITLTGAVTGSGTGSFVASLGSFTKSQLDTAVSDGNVMYVGDAPSAHNHDASAITTGTLGVARGGTGLAALGTSLQVLRTNAAGTANEYATITAGIGGSTGATDNCVLRSDGTGGATLQNSAVTIDDSGNVTGVAGLTASGTVTANGNLLVGNLTFKEIRFFNENYGLRLSSGTGFPIQFFTATGNYEFGNSALSLTSTGVGSLTTTPRSPFDTLSNGSQYPTIKDFYSMGYNSAYKNSIAGSFDGAVSNQNMMVLRVSTASGAGVVDVATFTGAGRVGIGTTTPAVTLDVVGAIAASGTVTIGGGTAIAKVLSATATLDFPSIASNDMHTLTMTVTGAIAGNAVFLGVPAALDANLIWQASVTAADTVTIRMHNASGASIDPASGTYRATVFQF